MSARVQAIDTPRKRRLGPAVCLGAIALCALWAFVPLRTDPIDSTVSTNESESAQPREPFDLAAFSAPIWYVAPPPPAPEAAPAPRPLPPFDLELIAIIELDGASQAVFYDPRADALVHVSVGQSLAEGRVVDAINADGVQIRDASGLRTVALERGAP